MAHIIWVEKLGLADLAALFVETLFTRASVRYDERKVSAIAGRTLAVAQRCGIGTNFHKARLTLNRKDAAGYALNYSMENDIDICLNRFCDTYIKDASARYKSALRLYIATYLTYRVTFVTMVEGEPRFHAAGGAQVLYLNRHPLNPIIITYYREKGYVVRESSSLSEYLILYLKPCYRLWSIILAKLSPMRVRTTVFDPKPSIWIEYAHGAEVQQPFWRESVDETMFDVVCYLDRNDAISLGEQIKEIENKKLRWIDLHFSSLVKFSGIGVRGLMDMGRAFFSCPAGLPFWFRVFAFEFRMWRLLYEPVFRRFTVKVLIQHQETLWIQFPQQAAIEAAGGIMLGFHWSNIPYYKLAFFATPQHVYFVWGKMMYAWIKKRGNICHHVLPAGVWLGQSKRDTGMTGLKDGLAFVMAVFDSSVTYNICQSEGTLDEFYLKILEMLEKNQDWGAIVKSKNWSRLYDLAFLPHGKEIIAQATLLIEQKRLVLLDHKISPVTASAHADLSVCYGMNSAGIISGIGGGRAVHWDCSGWLHNRFYGDRGQKFLFATLDDLEGAIVKAYHGDATIGDLSAWKQKLDYFNDGSGARRIGEFIQDFMVSVTATHDSTQSLDGAAKRYRELNNVDDGFFNENDGALWEDEMVHVMQKAPLAV